MNETLEKYCPICRVIQGYRHKEWCSFSLENRIEDESFIGRWILENGLEAEIFDNQGFSHSWIGIIFFESERKIGIWDRKGIYNPLIREGDRNKSLDLKSRIMGFKEIQKWQGKIER